MWFLLLLKFPILHSIKILEDLTFTNWSLLDIWLKLMLIVWWLDGIIGLFKWVIHVKHLVDANAVILLSLLWFTASDLVWIPISIQFWSLIYVISLVLNLFRIVITIWLLFNFIVKEIIDSTRLVLPIYMIIKSLLLFICSGYYRFILLMIHF